MAGSKGPRWLRAPELIKYCVNNLHMPIGDARARLYWDVIHGKVRAARAGVLLTFDEVQALADPRSIADPRVWFSSGLQLGDELACGKIGLPPDIHLLVADADQLYRADFHRFAPVPPPPSSTGALLSRGRRSGPLPRKREAAVAALRQAIEQGQLRQDDLRMMPWKAIAAFCGRDVSRATVRDARDALVAELGTPPPGETPPNKR